MEVGNIVINRASGFVGFIAFKEESTFRVIGFHGSSFRFKEEDLLLLKKDVLKPEFLESQIAELNDMLDDHNENPSR